MQPLTRQAGTEWNTFIRVADFSGTSFVPLVQIAALLNGRLEPKQPSEQVRLSLRGHTLKFSADSPKVLLGGKETQLEKPTVKNAEGFWVPFSFFSSDSFSKVAKTSLQWPPKEKALVKPAAVAPAAAAPAARKPISERAARHSNALKRITIDPGHGGKDPGATGPRGIMEKDVSLRFALDLAELLRETYGYEVLLTRMEDAFVPLEERARLANKHRADLFISLHCNASASPRQKGFEVYFLSEKASDPHADSVARLENAVLALEGKEVPSPNRVKQVLRSLEVTANINEASTAGALVERHLSDRLSEPSLGVKQAAFYVLRGAEMPSVLVEMAFISNREEERMLQSASFRKKMVEGIAAGVAAYDLRKQKERS